MFRQESKSPPPDEKPPREGALVRLFHPVPTRTGAKDLWINTDKPIGFEAGKVYLVHYWTFG